MEGLVCSDFQNEMFLLPEPLVLVTLILGPLPLSLEVGPGVKGFLDVGGLFGPRALKMSTLSFLALIRSFNIFLNFFPKRFLDGFRSDLAFCFRIDLVFLLSLVKLFRMLVRRRYEISLFALPINTTDCSRVLASSGPSMSPVWLVFMSSIWFQMLVSGPRTLQMLFCIFRKSLSLAKTSSLLSRGVEMYSSKLGAGYMFLGTGISFIIDSSTVLSGRYLFICLFTYFAMCSGIFHLLGMPSGVIGLNFLSIGVPFFVSFFLRIFFLPSLLFFFLCLPSESDDEESASSDDEPE